VHGTVLQPSEHPVAACEIACLRKPVALTQCYFFARDVLISLLAGRRKGLDLWLVPRKLGLLSEPERQSERSTNVRRERREKSGRDVCGMGVGERE
jgi:hypothetical protein